MTVLAAMVEGKVDTADIFFFIGLILGVLAALLYALGTRVVVHHTTTDVHTHRVSPAVWAPVALSLAVASIACAFWVL